MNKTKRGCCAVFLTFLLLTEASFGQQDQPKKPSGPRRQLATIMFAGLGGAVLGLSTLSFYGRPQDQLQNIAVGFALGVISGTIYVTFRTATTHEYNDEKNMKQGPGPMEGEKPQPQQGLKVSPLIETDAMAKNTYLGLQAVWEL